MHVNTTSITLLQVFIHDPLYKWALTPLGAQKRQKDDLAEESNPTEGAAPQAASLGMPAGSAGTAYSLLANADAERALLRLKQKLAGLEGGTYKEYSALLVCFCSLAVHAAEATRVVCRAR